MSGEIAELRKEIEAIKAVLLAEASRNVALMRLANPAPEQANEAEKPGKLFARKEASAYLDISEAQFDRKRAEHRIQPAVMFKRSPRFTHDQLDKLAELMGKDRPG